MPDPFQNIRPGDPLPTSEVTWNSMIDAGRAFRGRQRNVESGPLVTSRSTTIIRLKNDSSDDLLRGRILGLDFPIFTPAQDEDAALREVAFRGVEPAARHLHKFAVLLEPIAQDSIGRAVVSGVCWARVNVIDVDDGFADIDVGTTARLKSMGYGAAQILYTEDDESYSYSTGDQWAIVRLGLPARVLRKAKTGGSGIAAAAAEDTPGRATVTLCDWNDSTHKWVPNTQTVEALNPSPADPVDSNTFVTIGWVDGAWEVILEPCPSAYY